MKTIVLLHGRGSSPDDIIHLTRYFPGYAYAAPAARSGAWYPRSFLAPVEENEPELSESLEKVHKHLEGLEPKSVVLMGFSQGACLALEYAARHPQTYAGVVAFSGGLITLEHQGDLKGTPVFLGCSENDPHIPLERVEETLKVFKNLNASVSSLLYPGSSHTVTEAEIKHVQKILL